MMFKRILKQEFQNILRDKMYKFFAFYAVMIAVIGYFLMPYLENQNPLAGQIALLSFVLMNGFLFGAVTGFTLLDDRDDQVLLSLKVSPINVLTYIKTKLLISYIFGVFSTLLVLISTMYIFEQNLLISLMVIVLTPLQGPMIALIINAFASNKVEGFVIMKLSGILLLVPIAGIFLTDWKEIFLYVIPGFWPSRIVLFDIMPLNYLIQSVFVYFILGVIILLGCIYGLLKVYYKKALN